MLPCIVADEYASTPDAFWNSLEVLANVLPLRTFFDIPHMNNFYHAFWAREGQCYTYSYVPESAHNLTDDTTQEFLSLARTNNRAAFDELAGLYMTRDRIQGFWDGIRQRVGEGQHENR